MAQADPAITVITHQPERRRQRASVPAQAGGCCCCCCCCCLHTVGGLIGAAVAPTLGSGNRPVVPGSLMDVWNDAEFDPSAHPALVTNPEAITSNPPTPTPAPPEDSSIDRERAAALIVRRHSAVSLFWWTVLALSVIGFVFFLFYRDGEAGPRQGTDPLVSLMIIVLIFPVIQLGAVIVTAVILALSKRPDKSFQFRLLRKISVGLIVGTVVGAIGTVAVFYLIVH